MIYNGIELNVLIKGKAITEYPHNGALFVEGRDGSEFEIEVRNTLAHRIEAVVAVDGLSVIDGKDAGPSSSGYLLEAGETLRIPGWKLTDKQVAAFEFAGKSNSYATQTTGSNANNGVIGLMAFKEKPQAPVYAAFRGIMGSPTRGSIVKGMVGPAGQSRGIGGSANGWASIQCSSATSSLDASYGIASNTLGGEPYDAQDVQNLGTGFGSAQDFATTSVSFDRGDLHSMVVMYYDNARGLKARGIDMSRRARTRSTQTPVAFPGMTSGCTPPAGWRG